MGGIDILMITFNRPEYVRLSLPRLLESCPPDARVWLWHNGTDQPTLEAVQEHRHHPRMHRFHHSVENVPLAVPTNWMWSESTGNFLGKVDDDCLVTDGWLETLRAGLATAPELGIISCWHFMPEDVDMELAAAKLVEVAGGHRLMRNHWVQGSGYLTSRAVAERLGPIGAQDSGSFTRWCLRAARLGYVNGWYYPFVLLEHMDDPRSPHNMYRDDADFQARRPRSANATGVTTLAEWTDQMRQDAQRVQSASLDLRQYFGWRRRRRNLARRVRFAVLGKAPW